MDELILTAETTEEEIERFQSRRCAGCGEPARSHFHLFGSDRWLCPIATFQEPTATCTCDVFVQPCPVHWKPSKVA